MTTPLRIAMWSGPRNLSTALLRSWGNRTDTAVTDEPLYAHYLRAAGVDHPGRREILAAYDDDWRRVTDWLRGPAPGGQAIWYQKHMTHHITDDVDLGWLDALHNCFLIREPAEVIASYAEVRDEPTLEDLGLPQQGRVFSHVVDTAGTPPVIDAADLLRDPATVLAALCAAVGVAFSERMLWWPPGRRETDGVWAEHWYGAVECSTGFAPYEPRAVQLDARFAELRAAADDLYQRLAAHRLITVDA
ncbi:MAG: HAD family hydrolase [Actinobacteria bacterium]|nr:HAD family hydrolase [Actinomycetota bacterium]